MAMKIIRKVKLYDIVSALQIDALANLIEEKVKTKDKLTFEEVQKVLSNNQGE
jgi:hypothetical protein